MPSIPFSVYDFFGYLASGFLFIFAAIYVGTKKSIFCYDLNFVASVFVILVVYTIGHILAIPAKLFYERLVVERWLKPPAEILFRKNSPTTFLEKLFTEYYDSYPGEVIDKIETKAVNDGVWSDKKALFHYAYSKVRQNTALLSRQDVFLSLYGFCRNLSFTLLLVLLFIFFGGWHRGFLLNLIVCYASILASLGLFYRYLKFFRQYSYELFLSYLELSPAPKGSNQERKGTQRVKRKSK
jgi:hypothetical protein